jgi:soluble lytic murein transglycosylase-like protein
VLTEYPNADKFDQQIRGWVRYWNDIFQPSDPLDPNLIKALIATESGFNPKPKKRMAHMD